MAGAALALTLVVAAIGWVVLRGAGPAFSDHPRAIRVAFAQQNRDVLILYHRCGPEDLIPYVDAAEAIGDDRREWEVAAELWLPDEASWIARRHPVEEDPPRERFERPLPPASEVRLNVHVYSASIDDRWHVRVEELDVSDLPVVAVGPMDVLTADGETMERDDWTLRAAGNC